MSPTPATTAAVPQQPKLLDRLRYAVPGPALLDPHRGRLRRLVPSGSSCSTASGTRPRWGPAGGQRLPDPPGRRAAGWPRAPRPRPCAPCCSCTEQVLGLSSAGCGDVVRANRPKRLPVVLTPGRGAAAAGRPGRDAPADRHAPVRVRAAAAGVPAAAGQGRGLRRRSRSWCARARGTRTGGRCCPGSVRPDLLRATWTRVRELHGGGLGGRVTAGCTCRRRWTGSCPAAAAGGSGSTCSRRPGSRPTRGPGRCGGTTPHEGAVNRALMAAVRRAGLAKRATTPQLAALVRHPPDRGRVRHPDGAGIAGPRERGDDDDLHPCPEQGGSGVTSPLDRADAADSALPR